MSNYYIGTLENNDKILYPKTLASGVYLDDGTPISSKLVTFEKDGKVGEDTAINADTLDDHDANFFEYKENKVTSITEESDDEEYPSAKAVYDALQNAGDKLFLIELTKTENEDGTFTYTPNKTAKEIYDNCYRTNKPVYLHMSGYFDDYYIYQLVDAGGYDPGIDYFTFRYSYNPEYNGVSYRLITCYIDTDESSSTQWTFKYDWLEQYINQKYLPKYSISTSITSSSTHSELSTAKAVYDSMQSLSVTVYTISDTAPSDTKTIWIDSTNNVMKYYNGTTWVAPTAVWE